MSDDWNTLPLGDVLTFQRGYDITKETQVEGKYAVISSSGPKSTHAEFMVRGPGVVVGRKGTLGSVFFSIEDYWPHDTTLWVRDFHGNDPRFVFYFLQGMHFERFDVGASNPTLNRNHIHALSVHWPPLPTQRRIAAILSAYDDLIENCERRIRVLDEMARALYREWFVRDSQSENVLAQQLIDQGILEINDGYRAKNSELGSSGLPFARAGNVDDGFLFDGADQLAEENVPRAGAKVSRRDDIVFTSKGTVGRFAMVRERTPRFVYSPQLCFWRVLNAKVLSPHFLFRWMQTREFLDQVDGVKGSTDMADYVSLTNQRRMRVRIPTVAVQHRADGMLKHIDELTGTLTDERSALRKTRDLLLPRLLSGELSVEDAA